MGVGARCKERAVSYLAREASSARLKFGHVGRPPAEFLREFDEVHSVSLRERRLPNSMLFRVVPPAEADHPAV